MSVHVRINDGLIPPTNHFYPAASSWDVGPNGELTLWAVPEGQGPSRRVASYPAEGWSLVSADRQPEEFKGAGGG